MLLLFGQFSSFLLVISNKRKDRCHNCSCFTCAANEKRRSESQLALLLNSTIQQLISSDQLLLSTGRSKKELKQEFEFSLLQSVLRLERHIGRSIETRSLIRLIWLVLHPVEMTAGHLFALSLLYNPSFCGLFVKITLNF